jgi:Ca2+-binding RTX toxin-like protein
MDGQRARPSTRVDDPGNNTVTVTASTRVVCDNRPTSGRDVVDGRDDDSILCGLGGRDTLRGNGGTDRIFGGAGRDSLVGGWGRDLLVGGGGSDRCRERQDIRRSCER